MFLIVGVWNLSLESRKESDPMVAKIGSLVRVWREKGRWSGPFTLLAVEGGGCTVDANGARIFRIPSTESTPSCASVT
ncbi:hypothetical protein ColTof4_13836 [Colletotrichum tofieldiae]|nr:hypothetical protein ColTof4_13836 [Colletotrichum tofieldiae]